MKFHIIGGLFTGLALLGLAAVSQAQNVTDAVELTKQAAETQRQAIVMRGM